LVQLDLDRQSIMNLGGEFILRKLMAEAQQDPQSLLPSPAYLGRA
jgi:hypothetical protein